ncbi:acid-sensing ion channel 2-like [Stylophora pistillata]|uniref:acid-sensing ion channel 2-like n=1 Tax=Stylophora pistillata TaxID=50429 RepID=UPI000C03D54D|nr:acid-sensing ion channel 2-like [Stylophora pistillata]XP_022780236.1 acid-sensing ion channel 2-like [Stylophora pistillata]
MIPVESTEPATASFKEVIKSKSPLLSKWREFATNTTVHGLRYVIQTSLPSYRRMVWALLLVAASGAYFYNSTRSFKKYFSRPIKTEISQETPLDGLKFPAVTICNLNQFMKMKIDTTDEDEYFEKLGLNISGCSETRRVRGNLTCGQALLCAFVDFGPLLVDNCDFSTRHRIMSVLNHSKRIYDEKEFLSKYGHDLFGDRSMSGPSKYCVFEDEEQIKCSEQHFVPIVTNGGICYTFNSGYNGSAKIELFRSLYEGSDLGLPIALDVQTNESTFSSSSSGLSVIVHDQDTFVNYHSGFKVQPGTHASVAVKLTQYKRLPSPYRTNCSKVDSLAGIKSYTKDGCIYQCRSNHSMDKCGCRRDYALPDLRGLPVCSFQDRPCLQKPKSKETIVFNKSFSLPQ